MLQFVRKSYSFVYSFLEYHKVKDSISVTCILVGLLCFYFIWPLNIFYQLKRSSIEVVLHWQDGKDASIKYHV